MTFTDWIGSLGVTILLVAYFLNVRNIVAKDSFIYLFLNIFGAGLACVASILLKYIPFIILEICWTVFSTFELFLFLKSKRTKKNV
jgi:hypothetical protein